MPFALNSHFMKKLPHTRKLSPFTERKTEKNGDFLTFRGQNGPEGSMSRDESVSTKGAPHPKLSFYEKDTSMFSVLYESGMSSLHM